MNIQLHRVSAGLYYTKALGFKIHVVRTKPPGCALYWQAESDDPRFPVFTGHTKTDVVMKVNIYLSGMVQRGPAQPR